MSTRPLTEREQRVFDLLQDPTGLKIQDIATRVGVCRRTVWEIKQRPHFQAALEESKKEENTRWKTMLHSLVPRAINHLSEAINGKPSTHSIKAALSILAATGLAEKPEPTLASRVQGTVVIDFGLPKSAIEDPVLVLPSPQVPTQITATVAAQTVVAPGQK